MTKYFWIFSLILSNFNCYSQNNKEFERFLSAIAIVESSNNPKAVGDSGKSIGIFQIQKNYFLDAQEFNKNLRKYQHKDCFSPEIAKIVVISYFQRYAPKELKTNNFEALARLHNSGPGWKNKKNKTEIYWGKVKKALNTQN
jgi:hypothetical protein